MKKIILFLLIIPSLLLADDRLILVTQRNTNSIGSYATYPIFPAATSGAALSMIDLGSQLPGYLTIGTGLSAANGVLSTSGAGNQVNADWSASSGLAQILNKPALFSGAYADLTGKPVLATVAVSGSYLDLANKPAIPAGYSFNFGDAVTRTLALATSYQASTPGKAAHLTVSVSCAATLSGTTSTPCTVQARISASTATCSTGTVVAQWAQTKTGSIGLNNATDTNVAPDTISLPAGYSFIICQTTGTGATIPIAVDQTVG